MGSQLGLFVVSSLGAKHGAFHSEDETQKVASGKPKRARRQAKRLDIDTNNYIHRYVHRQLLG